MEPKDSTMEWGHIAPHCPAAAPKCVLCSKNHQTADHRCPVEGCRAGRGHQSAHGITRCANCGGPHGARADVRAHKGEVRRIARGWRSPPPHGGSEEGLRPLPRLPVRRPRPPKMERCQAARRRPRWRRGMDRPRRWGQGSRGVERVLSSSFLSFPFLCWQGGVSFSPSFCQADPGGKETWDTSL